MKRTAKKAVSGILAMLAGIAIRRHKSKVIAVTGNVGKTSTKDAVYTIVASAFDARRSEKSMNSEIGLPLAVFGLETAWNSPSGWLKNIFRAFGSAFFGRYFPEWLILEAGADHPGDIRKIAKWLHPDIVVLTRMSETPVHLEFFRDAKEVLEEKMHLARALKPGGTLVVNADDPMFMGACAELPFRKITYGEAKGADVRLLSSEAMYGKDSLPLPRGQYGVFEIVGKKERIELQGVVGKHTMYSAAAACAIGHILGIDDDLAGALSHIDLPKGRMRTLEGREKSLIIDDTYNSSPIACSEALKTLKELTVKGKKVAVLGDMKELGESAKTAHREIGRQAGEFVHTLVSVGELSDEVAAGAGEAGMPAERIFRYGTAAEAADALARLARAGDVVLVKGSQSMRMERVVATLLADPSSARDFLVRQEDEWRKR